MTIRRALVVLLLATLSLAFSAAFAHPQAAGSAPSPGGRVVDTPLSGDWRRLVPASTPAARALRVDRYVLLAASIAVQTSFFGFLLSRGRAWKIQDAVERRVRRRALAAPVYLLLLLMLYRFALAPVAYVSYRIDRHLGIATQSDWKWIADLLRAWLVNTIVIIPVLLVLLWAMRRWRRRWWLAAAVLTGLVSAGMVYVMPLVVDPLFHQFRPLKDPALAASILDLAARSHVHVNGVFVGKFSSTTTEGNAYVTGIGGSQRIVLWDTLLTSRPHGVKYAPGEIRSIVAHELGHYARHHIRRGLMMGVAGSLALFWLTHLMLWIGLKRGLIRRWGEPASVPALAACILLLNVIGMPLANAVSREMEREADDFSLHLTGDPASFIGAMQRLSLQDYDKPWPNPIEEAIFYTHPAISERIHAAVNYARSRGPVWPTLR